ncbi:MAG: hypothetical protein WA254_04910 [Candidatus Sulfotelmatobacter sp.]
MSQGPKKYALGLAAVALVAFIGWYFWGPGGVPLISLNQSNVDQFRQAFDGSAKDTRVVLLLSPT